MFFGVLVIIFVSLIFDLFVRIDQTSFHWYWNFPLGELENCLWALSKPDIGVLFPCSFSKVVARVPVGCSDLFPSIYWFAWSKISSTFLVQAFFCWLLTCLYNIYRSRIHLSWILSLGVLENCYWALYKPDIRIFSPRRFVEGCGEGASFCDFSCRHQYINILQGI